MSNECFPLSAIKSMYMQLLHCFLCKHHCQAVILINEAFPLAFLSVKCTRYRTQSISTVKRVFLVYLIVTKCLINVSVSEKTALKYHFSFTRRSARMYPIINNRRAKNVFAF